MGLGEIVARKFSRLQSGRCDVMATLAENVAQQGSQLCRDSKTINGDKTQTEHNNIAMDLASASSGS